MFAKEWWAGLALFCGAIIALGTVLRKTGRIVWMSFGVMKQLQDFLEDALPDEKNKKPGLMEMVRDTQATVQDLNARQEKTANELEATKRQLEAFREEFRNHGHNGNGTVSVRDLTRRRQR